MIKQMVCLLDAAAGCYGQPIFCPSVGVIVRSLTDEANNRESGNDISKHPEDFTLFHFGEFDDVTGKFKLLDIPVMICRAADLVRKVS